MKILKTGFVLASLLISFSLSAQKTLSEGTLVYNISIQTGTQEPQMADMLDGATTTIYIKVARAEVKW